mgnify:FL=1
METINVDRSVSDALKSIEQADEDAERAQLAFVLGDFQAYYESRYAAARQRLEDRYRELNERAANPE